MKKILVWCVAAILPVSDSPSQDTDLTYYIYVYSNGYSVNDTHYQFSDNEYVNILLGALDWEYATCKNGYIKQYNDIFIPHGSSRDHTLK